MDIHKKDDNFEQELIKKLTEFLQMEAMREQSDRMSMAASWTPDEQQSVASMSMPTPTMSSGVEMQRMLRLHGHVGSGNTSHNSDRGHSTQGHSELGMDLAATPTTGGWGHPQESVHDGGSSDVHSQDEVAFLHAGKDAGVVYILGNNIVKARKDGGFFKKLAINYIYTFLRRISRDSRVVLHIPHECLLQVGMVYYV